jgi:hypothetical protein
MKYKKEDLEKLIFEEKVSYEAIGRQYSVSGAAIKKAARRLGIELPVRQKFPKDFEPANKGKKKEREKFYCVNCNNEIVNLGKKYCSMDCQIDYKHKSFYKDFLENNDKYCRENYSLRPLKPFFLKEQNNKCLVCGIKIWN